MPNTVEALIDAGDDRVEWIKSLLERYKINWNVLNVIDNDLQNPVNKSWIVANSLIVVEKWSIHVHLSRSSVNEASRIYANIWWKTIQVWTTSSQSYEKGWNTWTFMWSKWTLLEWLKHQFHANNKDVLDSNFREWMIEELSKKYPDDYESQKEDVTSHVWETEEWIVFKYESKSWEKHFSFSCEYKWKKITWIPIVERRSWKYLVKLVAKNKRWIAWNQFEKLVTWKDSKLLASVWKMIDEFVKVLEWNHSGIKKNWNVEDFQAIASSFQSSDL